MPYLTAAVVILAFLGLANMVVTAGLVRRLRSMEGHPGGMTASGIPPTLAVGESPGEFTADLDGGLRLRRGDLAGGRSLIGFFSVSCIPCRENAPRFAEYAAGFDAGRVMAVIQGEASATAAFVAEHLGDGTVAVASESEGGPLAKAFGVAAFPTFYILDDQGRVEHAGFSVARLSATAGA